MKTQAIIIISFLIFALSVSPAKPDSFMKMINKEIKQGLIIDLNYENLFRINFIEGKPDVQNVSLNPEFRWDYLFQFYKSKKNIKMICESSDKLVLSPRGNIRYYIKRMPYEVPNYFSPYQYVIYSENLITGQTKTLSKNFIFNTRLALSEDGKYLASYCSKEPSAVTDGTYGLCVLLADGSLEDKQIAPPSLAMLPPERAFPPKWSKTGNIFLLISLIMNHMKAYMLLK